MIDDPYANLRHLDGKMIHVKVPRLTEDVDGRPLGVEMEDLGGGTLYLPPLPQEEADDE